MPATPAWPPQSLPRLFVDQALAEGAQRRPSTAPISAPSCGSGRATRSSCSTTAPANGSPRSPRRGRSASRSPSASGCASARAVPDLWLLFAPIKRGRIDWLVEKATELGVARLQPVITRRTIVDRLNLERLRAHAIEAAEQCERTALPELAEPQKLEALLKAWPADRALYFADEARRRAVRARARPRRDPDRPRGRLHRRGARRDPRLAPGPPGLARPAHPARRHRGAGGGQPVDGRGRGLARTGWRIAPRLRARR